MTASSFPFLQYCPPAPAWVNLDVLYCSLLPCSPQLLPPHCLPIPFGLHLFRLSCWDGCNPQWNVAYRPLQDLGVWLWRATDAECKAGKQPPITWQPREGRAGYLWAVQCAWMSRQLIRWKIEARLLGFMCHFPIHCVWVMYSRPAVWINIFHSYFLLQSPLGQLFPTQLHQCAEDVMSKCVEQRKEERELHAEHLRSFSFNHISVKAAAHNTSFTCTVSCTQISYSGLFFRFLFVFICSQSIQSICKENPKLLVGPNLVTQPLHLGCWCVLESILEK